MTPPFALCGPWLRFDTSPASADGQRATGILAQSSHVQTSYTYKSVAGAREVR